MTFAEVSKIVRKFPGCKLEDILATVRAAGHKINCDADHPEAEYSEYSQTFLRFADLSEKTASLVADRHAYTLAVKIVEDFRARARLAFDVRVGSVGRVKTGSGYAPGRYEVVRIDFNAAHAVTTRFGVGMPCVVNAVFGGAEVRTLTAKSSGAAAYAGQRLITAKRIIPTGNDEREELPLEFVDGKLMEVHPDGTMKEVVAVESPGLKYDDIRPGMPLGAFSFWEPNLHGLFDTYTDDSTVNALMAGAVERDCYGLALSMIADRITEAGELPTEPLRRTGAHPVAVADHIRKLGAKPKYTAPLRGRWNR